MLFALSTTALVAMASSAYAQVPDPKFNSIFAPDKDQTINAGEHFDIKWSVEGEYAKGTVSIKLIGGESQGTLMPIEGGVIANGVSNTEKHYPWTVDCVLGNKAIYGLIMTLESNTTVFQYSPPFHIKPCANAQGSKTTTPSPIPQVATTTNKPGASVSNTLAAGVSNTPAADTSCSTTSVPVATASAKNVIHSSITLTTSSRTTTSLNSSMPTTMARSSSSAGNAPAQATSVISSAARAGSLSLVGALAVAVLAL